jgi:hypothetical protein
MQEAKELDQVKLVEGKYPSNDNRWDNQRHQQRPGHIPESLPGIRAVNSGHIEYYAKELLAYHNHTIYLKHFTDYPGQSVQLINVQGVE